VHVRGATAATAFISAIAYNARGQRTEVVYGNHTSTTFTYDPQRFWLARLVTARSAASSHGAATLQDLAYSRDRVGNVTGIVDGAQETVYFANAQVSPDRSFTYDALYRLIRATGREKVGQAQTTAFYAGYAGAMGAIPDSGDPALRAYTQSYTFDASGNLTEMKHQQGTSGPVLWRRGCAIAAGSNQLVSSSVPGDDPDDPGTHSDVYAYDARGALIFLPHLKAGVGQNLTRDFRDQLRRADLDSAGNVAWYTTDAAGQRVRKVWDKGSTVEERISIGGYEVWRHRNGAGVVQEERQTLHVMDGERRIAMVETLTVSGGSAVGTPAPRSRHTLDDHLGTSVVEVDGDGGVISHEEYHPFGTTAWWAESSAIEVSRKRYRYTGKEKDEETGLYHHGHRYHLAWLGRWDRPDPIGLGDGLNRWGYVGGRVLRSVDPDGLARRDERDRGRAPPRGGKAAEPVPAPAEAGNEPGLTLAGLRAGGSSVPLNADQQGALAHLADEARKVGDRELGMLVLHDPADPTAPLVFVRSALRLGPQGAEQRGDFSGSYLIGPKDFTPEEAIEIAAQLGRPDLRLLGTIHSHALGGGDFSAFHASGPNRYHSGDELKAVVTDPMHVRLTGSVRPNKDGTYTATLVLRTPHRVQRDAAEVDPRAVGDGLGDIVARMEALGKVHDFAVRMYTGDLSGGTSRGASLGRVTPKTSDIMLFDGIETNPDFVKFRIQWK
jgi:RHS repeat-associated protein